MSEEIKFVVCVDCGNEQADMGANVACEECGGPTEPTPPKAGGRP